MLGMWEALGTHRFEADLFGSCLVSGGGAGGEGERGALGTHRFKADLFGSCLIYGRHLGPTDLKQTYSDHAWYMGGTWDPQI